MSYKSTDTEKENARKDPKARYIFEVGYNNDGGYPTGGGYRCGNGAADCTVTGSGDAGLVQ